MTLNLYEKYHQKSKHQVKVISSNNFTYRNIIEIVARNLINKRKLRLLDIGCGVGTMDFYIFSKFNVNEILGIDISKKAIEMATRTSKLLGYDNNIQFKHLKFPNKVIKGGYDIILCTEVLEHLSDDRAALVSMNKLLRKKGLLILTTPSKNAPLYRLGLAGSFDSEVGHLRRYTVENLTRIMKSSGFQIVSLKKKEGILRNSLFILPILGVFVRFIKGPISDLVTILDNLSVFLFGESDLVVLAVKK